MSGAGPGSAIVVTEKLSVRVAEGRVGNERIIGVESLSLVDN